MNDTFRIAVVSGKLGDVDGVSLEVDKWINVLASLGHTLFTISGKYATPIDKVPDANQFLLEQIRFDSPEQRHYERQLFPHLTKRPPKVSPEMRRQLQEELITHAHDVTASLWDYVQRNSIDLIVGENTNAMPMSLLAALGVHDLATEYRIATLFHHHDFWWERSRFSSNYIEGLLNRIMPPTDVGTEHVVISSYAAHILSTLKRLRPKVVPNCEDFENPPVKDDYNENFRADLGFRDDDLLIVQPTRIVRRKRIEDSVRLVGRLVEKYPDIRDRLQYVISLYQGDEPDDDYVGEIQRVAEQLGVQLHLISDRVASVRGEDDQGRRLYTNRDVLAHADAVTYLPVWEGFGNALLEAVAARKPVVTTTYLVYKTDIKMAGFRNIEILDDYDDDGALVIPDKAVDDLRFVLIHPEVRDEIVEHNFEMGKRSFSLRSLRYRLEGIITDYGDEIRASRSRLKKAKAAYSV
jgi:glycosyltransferase involved in cell wall biosynthesis